VTSLFEKVKALDLPGNDFAIFGSGPLIARNIIPASNDLDVICRGLAWDKVKAMGTIEHLGDYDLDIVTMYDGQLTFGTRWGIGDFDTNELIDGAENIAGLPFVRLKHVAGYKKISRRPKDLEHLEALQAYLAREQTGNKRDNACS
jgi:hypothetical protein